MKWISLINKKQLQQLIEISVEKPQLIFKHSTRCGISRMALKNFETEYSINANELDCYYLDLLNYRSISNEIANTFQVIHQSPQVIVIKNKKAIYSASHEQISINEILRLIILKNNIEKYTI